MKNKLTNVLPKNSEKMESSADSKARLLKNRTKSDKRRTTHTTNPHQSKEGSRRTDDR